MLVIKVKIRNFHPRIIPLSSYIDHFKCKYLDIESHACIRKSLYCTVLYIETCSGFEYSHDYILQHGKKIQGVML